MPQSKSKIIYKKSTYYLLLITFYFLLEIVSCRCDKNKIFPDISNIIVDIKIERFEQDLYSIDTTAYESEIKKLREKYPDFFELYVKKIMRLGLPGDTIQTYISNLNKLLLQDKPMQGLYDTCMAKYGDLSSIENELETAFSYYKYYFPGNPIPKKVLTFISQFGYSAITYDTILGIGLDMYLGEDYKYYPTFGFPHYVIRRLKREYIVANCMKAIIKNIYPPVVGHGEKDEGNKQLLGNMLYNGKILYYLDMVLPDNPDSIKIGYSQKQIDWCKKNEFDIWAFFIENNLLYSSDYLDYQQYINDGPTTVGMPLGAPGNIGSWVGWQIIRKYMKKNPTFTFRQLMEEKEPVKILTNAQYKPKT